MANGRVRTERRVRGQELSCRTERVTTELVTWLSLLVLLLHSDYFSPVSQGLVKILGLRTLLTPAPSLAVAVPPLPPELWREIIKLAVRPIKLHRPPSRPGRPYRHPHRALPRLMDVL